MLNVANISTRFFRTDRQHQSIPIIATVLLLFTLPVGIILQFKPIILDYTLLFVSFLSHFLRMKWELSFVQHTHLQPTTPAYLSHWTILLANALHHYRLDWSGSQDICYQSQIFQHLHTRVLGRTHTHTHVRALLAWLYPPIEAPACCNKDMNDCMANSLN